MILVQYFELKRVVGAGHPLAPLLDRHQLGRRRRYTGNLKSLDFTRPNPCTYCCLVKGSPARDCKNSEKDKMPMKL